VQQIVHFAAGSVTDLRTDPDDSCSDCVDFRVDRNDRDVSRGHNAGRWSTDSATRWGLRLAHDAKAGKFVDERADGRTVESGVRSDLGAGR